jgi:hypothetical protein
MAEGASENRRDIELANDCIDDVDRALNPLGRFWLLRALCEARLLEAGCITASDAV